MSPIPLSLTLISGVFAYLFVSAHDAFYLGVTVTAGLASIAVAIIDGANSIIKAINAKKY